MFCFTFFTVHHISRDGSVQLECVKNERKDTPFNFDGYMIHAVLVGVRTHSIPLSVPEVQHAPSLQIYHLSLEFYGHSFNFSTGEVSDGKTLDTEDGGSLVLTSLLSVSQNSVWRLIHNLPRRWEEGGFVSLSGCSPCWAPLALPPHLVATRSHHELLV